MKVWVLGSGTGIPRSTRGAAGYVVQAGGASLLFDCGMGTMTRLLRVGLDYQSIDYLFLSHHHADHCADTVALLFANSLESERRAGRPLHIVGPTGTTAFIHGLYQAFPSLAPTEYPVVVEDRMEGTYRTDDFAVHVGPVRHGSIAAVGFHVEADGRRVVYSGDTCECDEVVDLARRADIFISECSYPDGRVTPWHLTPSQVGRLASKAGAGRVVLSHLYPDCDGVDVQSQCAATFDGPIEVARDCTEVEKV